MTIATGEANLAISRHLVASLVASGLRHAIVCPGSRSTPLAVAFATCSRVQAWVLVDERSAAYFALGMARQLSAPVAILCTSGTAAANFFPAVVEASLSRIPLIVLTADRPPELRGWGAAQTIDQLNLYGSHVKWFADLPVPADESTLIAHARAAAFRAMQTAASAPAGPVHLNLPFREPLLPPTMEHLCLTMPNSADRHSIATTQSPEVPPLPVRWERGLGGEGQRRGVNDSSPPPTAALADLATTIASEPKGIIVAGPNEIQGSAATLAEFSRVTGYPVLADPLSGARFGPHRPRHQIDAYDSFLRDPEIAAALQCDVVIRLGAIPTSKPLQQFLTAHPGKQHILLDPGPPRDPFHLATSNLHVEPAAALQHLCQLLSPPLARPDPGWSARWQNANQTASTAIACALAGNDDLSEGRALAEVAAALPDAATLVVGNSMPVRDADTFIRGDERAITLVANRGANGIDGVISSALGAAAVSRHPTVLVVGDLSFYHDMNGLLAARQFGITATVVVLNNNGGGIFSFLPQADVLDGPLFDRLFGTPIDLDVQRAARLYGATYTRPATWPAFRAALCRSLHGPGLSIVEVATDRAMNVRQHRAISAQVVAALRQARGDGI